MQVTGDAGSCDRVSAIDLTSVSAWDSGPGVCRMRGVR